MATIATCKQFIQQHPNDSLMETFAFLDTDVPSNYTSWFDALQNVYVAWLQEHPTTLSDFSLAVYTYWTNPANVPNWPDRLTSAQLTQALTSLMQPNQDYSAPTTTPAFPDAALIAAAVNGYYLDISIVIDADNVLSSYNNSVAQFSYIGNDVAMTDNHSSTSSGEGSDELSSEGLEPNMTITWTATAKNGDHAIEMIGYEAEGNNPFGELYPMPVQMPGQPNVWVTKANPTLPPSYEVVYTYHLNIDNGAATFWFDPYLGDTRD